MNGLPRLLLDLGCAGVELATHQKAENRLKHRPAVLAADLSARLRMHKANILGLLARGSGYAPDPATDPEAAYILNERLGIADDSNMPTHPGSPAWLIAVGASMGKNNA